MVDTDADSLVGALEVRKQALRGFSLAGLLAVGVYVLFVLVPGGRSPGLYLVLTFVLAVSGGLLLTTVLALGAAYRLSRRTE